MVSARAAPTPATPPTRFFRSPVFAVLLIASAALIAYANSFAVPFVFDDDLAILANRSIRHLGTSWSPPMDEGGSPVAGRPLLNFSLGLNYAFTGTHVWSYHGFNLLVHLTAGALLFGVMRRTLLQPILAARFGRYAFEIALWIALLWTLHPLQTESVTYLSQRAEALVGLLYFLTVWCFIRSAESGASPGWKFGAFFACLAGMGTKEVMVSVPLFIALYDRAFLSGSWREVWTRRHKLLLALASTWLLLVYLVLRGGGVRGASAGFGLGVSPWGYLLTQCQAILLYLKLTFWPRPLILDYGTAIVASATEVWWQGICLLTFFAGTIWAVVKKPVLGCVGAWFFMILAPSSSLVPVVGQTIAEHRMYLPLAAIAVLAVLGAFLALGTKARPLLLAIALALMWVTVRRNEDYSSAIRICEDTLAKRPGNDRAMVLLANYYHRDGKLDQARQWLERSLQRQPDSLPALLNLGNVWQEIGDNAKAVDYFQRALALQPRDAGVLNNLGNALILSGHASEGIMRLRTAVEIRPDHPGARANLAAALAQTGQMAEAAVNFEQWLKLKPDDADARGNYSNVLLALGRRDEAIAQLQAAVQFKPSDAELRNHLGTLLGRAGRLQEALAQFQEALRLNPNLDSARQNAARAQRLLSGG